MTIERTFQRLRQQLGELEEALDALATTVEQDRPAGDDVIVASRLSDAVLAARGHLQESAAAAGVAFGAVVHPSDTDGARQALVSCQEQFHLFAKGFGEEIASYERWDDLTSVGQRRGRKWIGWVSVVQETLRHCRGLTNDVWSALFLCWQELTDRTSGRAVSVHNVQIGQKVTVARHPIIERSGEVVT